MTQQQIGMLGSLGFTFALILSLVFSIRQARKRNERPQPKNIKQTTINEMVSFPETGLTYGSDAADDAEGDFENAQIFIPIDSDPSSLTPDKYQTDVAARTPAQLLKLNDTYRGTQIRWLMLFKELRRNPVSERAVLRFLEETTWLGVTCQVDLTQFPQVETWRANEKVWVTGTIQDAGTESIALDNVSFANF